MAADWPLAWVWKLFVSDSGNHRVVVLEKDGRFVASIGSASGEPGFADGDFDSARFTSPQGLAVLDGVREGREGAKAVGGGGG